MTVAELEARVTHRELLDWVAYDQVDPIGSWRADRNAALIAAMIANANRGRNQRAFQPQDFMPKFEPDSPAEVSRQVLEVFANLERKPNGRDH